MTPYDVTPNTKRKAWWICKKGHEWEASISNRNRKRGCPYCNYKTSVPELRIYTELKYLFNDTLLRSKIKGIECDILIPSKKIAIEYDGIYWHRNKITKDKKKNKFLSDNGIKLIRIRENGLKKVSSIDIILPKHVNDFKIIEYILNEIIKILNIDDIEKSKIVRYLSEGNLKNNRKFLELLELLPSPSPENSLQYLNSKLSKEWHPTKNGNLSTKDVTIGSSKKVWWLCKNGHEWEAEIRNRNNGTGCPYCSGRKASKVNNLALINPKLAKQWHPTKNGDLTPSAVTSGSNKKVWWICKIGHEWEAVIAERNKGGGCPYCGHKKISSTNNLAFVNPILSKEWHPIRNGNLTPKDVMPNTNKKAWWRCMKNHEWEATINSRNSGNCCPYCSNKMVNHENCLLTTNPILASQWHPTKNKKLKPDNVSFGSGKKVWWICKKKHEWEAVIVNRNNGTGCPYCKKKTSKFVQT